MMSACNSTPVIKEWNIMDLNPIHSQSQYFTRKFELLYFHFTLFDCLTLIDVLPSLRDLFSHSVR